MSLEKKKLNRLYSLMQRLEQDGNDEAAAACKVYLLRCGAILSALVSAWWLCAIVEGTAGGVTGPLVLAGVCAWLALSLARAAERGDIDGED